MKKNKAQIKIQQMAFMLIAVTLFFSLAGLFALSIKMSQISKEATILEEENAKLLASALSNSPEFSCGDSFENAKTNCIDADKVMALKDKSNIAKYTGFWGVASIEIAKIYPVSSKETNCTRANYPECSRIVVYNKPVKTNYPISTFVSLCRKEFIANEIGERCELARLEIKSEQKL